MKLSQMTIVTSRLSRRKTTVKLSQSYRNVTVEFPLIYREVIAKVLQRSSEVVVKLPLTYRKVTTEFSQWGRVEGGGGG